MRNLLIVTSDKFPNSDAGAVRSECLSRMFQMLGFQVWVLGFGSYTGKNFSEYKSIRFRSLRFKRRDKFHRIMARLASPFSVKKALRSISAPDVILVVSPSEMTVRFLKRYAKKNNIQLLHDAVEWYSPEEFKLGRFAHAYRQKDRNNRKIIDRQFSVISISTFLERHFIQKGVNTVRIPAVMDVHSFSPTKNIRRDKIVFLYAGSPGKKDYLSVMLQGMTMIPESIRCCFEIRLLGVTEEQLKDCYNISDNVFSAFGDSLKCFGRVPRQEVLQQLSESDFSMLLRPSELRYARAGFPTKVVESLASGTPVITNLSSDLSLYLNDGINSLIVSDCTAEAFSGAFLKAVQMTYEDRCRMQRNARETAEKHFDYSCYLSELESLILKQG